MDSLRWWEGTKGAVKIENAQVRETMALRGGGVVLCMHCSLTVLEEKSARVSSNCDAESWPFA